MFKHRNIIYIVASILLCLLFFLSNWFKDQISTQLWLLVLILYFCLFFSFCLLLMKVLFNLKNNISIKNGIPLVFLIITIIISLIDFRLPKTRFELKLYQTKRDEIISLVKEDTSLKDYIGDVQLPKYKYLSQDGTIYIYENNDNLMLSFWISRNTKDSTFELIYSTSDEDFITERKEDYFYLNIVHLNDNWYYVETIY